MATPRALKQLLLFIALNYLTSAAFIANSCSHLIPPKKTKKLAPHVPQNVHFKIRCYMDKIQKLASSKVFYRCD